MQLPKRESESEGFKHFHRLAVLPVRRPQLRLRSVGTFITIKVPETSVLLYENRILVSRLPKPCTILSSNFRPHRTGGSAHCCPSDRRDLYQFSSANSVSWQFPRAHLKVGTDLFICRCLCCCRGVVAVTMQLDFPWCVRVAGSSSCDAAVFSEDS